MLFANVIQARGIRLLFAISGKYIKTKHLGSDLTFIRHAQSQYNVESEKYIRENNIKNLSWDQICQIEDFNLDINYNKKFIDSDLSDQGSIQCQILKSQYYEKSFNYDLILVSPMLRALRTCRNVFGTFSTPRIVLPELTQVLRYSCDVSKQIEEKRQEFKEMDFSRFMKGDNYWFLDIQPKEISQKIIITMADKQVNTYKQAQEELVLMMYDRKIYQSDYHLRLRTQKVKRIIAEYRKSYQKILVISHHYMIQNLLAHGYRKNHSPIISVYDQVPNAVPIQTSVSQILSVV